MTVQRKFLLAERVFLFSRLGSTVAISVAREISAGKREFRDLTCLGSVTRLSPSRSRSINLGNLSGTNGTFRVGRRGPKLIDQGNLFGHRNQQKEIRKLNQYACFFALCGPSFEGSVTSHCWGKKQREERRCDSRERRKSSLPHVGSQISQNAVISKATTNISFVTSLLVENTYRSKKRSTFFYRTTAPKKTDYHHKSTSGH